MYKNEDEKLNIPNDLRLKGELRKEMQEKEVDFEKMGTVDLEKELKKRKQAMVQKRQEVSENRHTELLGGITKITDGLRELYKKNVQFPDIQKIKGSVTAKIDNFPDVQKVRGDVISKITNWPDVFKVEGKVKTEVTNWPEQKDVNFPDVQKVEVQNQPQSIEITNLPVGQGEEAGSGAKPDRYVPVRLTDGKGFYNAIQSAMSSIGSLLPFRDSQGKPAQGNLDDAGNLKVNLAEGSVSVNGADGAIQDGANSAIKATVRDYTNSNPVTIELVDENGDPYNSSNKLPVDATANVSIEEPLTVDGQVSISGTVGVALSEYTPVDGKLPVDASVSINEPLTVDGQVSISGTTTVQATNLDIRDLTSASDSIAAVQSGTWDINDITGSLPLPTGASTATKQDSIITELQNIGSGKLEETTFTARIGEVQASPTTNTLLGRIKSVEDKLDTLETTNNSIQTAVEVIDNVVSGSEAQVDVITLPSVTLASQASPFTNDVNVSLNGETVTVAGTVTTTIPEPLTVDGQVSVSGTVSSAQSGTWNINNISGTVSLPTGASTAANQSTIIGHVDGIEGLLGTIDTDTGNMATAAAAIETAVERIDDAVATISSTDLVRVAMFDDSNTQITSFGGGTQYTEGNTDATITGTAVMWEDAGDTLRAVSASNPLPVDAQVSISEPLTVDGQVSVSGTVTVQSANLDIRDLSSASDSVSVVQSGTWNLNNVSGTISLPTGASTSANQSTIISHVDGIETLLGTIDTDTSTLAGAVSGTEMQVDVVSSALPTGAATAANQSTIIGHVDGIEGLLTTIDADTGNLPTIETNTDFGTVVGGGTETGALRVTLANNSTGVLSVDDNGGSLTVDGTVTANLSATDNAVLDSIDTSTQGILADTAAIQAAVETIDNAISGSEMQVDVVGSLPAGDNNIGNVDLASAIPAGTNTIGKIAPNEYELAGNTTHVKKYYTNAGAVTDGIVWSPAAGKRWYITDIIINVSAAATVTLEDDLTAGDSPVFKAELAANSGFTHSFNTPLYSGEDAADLLITTSAGNVYVTVTGYEI